MLYTGTLLRRGLLGTEHPISEHYAMIFLRIFVALHTATTSVVSLAPFLALVLW